MIVYEIRDQVDGKRYVGITSRTLTCRLRAHWYGAGRDARRRAGSLLSAMSEARMKGEQLLQRFSIRPLEETNCVEHARTREAAWIADLATAAPAGFNIMPGGASVGGPSNSRPVKVRVPDRGELSFPSLGAAWQSCCDRWEGVDARQRVAWQALGQHLPAIGLSYARVAMGWSPEEALGLAPHVDRRGERAEPLLIGGKMVGALRNASTVASVATLRSRAHRARQAGLPASADLAIDRRRGRGSRTRRRDVLLPDPAAPGGPRRLSVRAFASRLGLPTSTVLHRLRRLERTCPGVDRMASKTLLSWLTAPAEERRTIVEVILPDGMRFEGGQRELAERVQTDSLVQALRTEIIGISAIRRRLRLVGTRATNQALLWALGLRGGRVPDGG